MTAIAASDRPVSEIQTYSRLVSSLTGTNTLRAIHR